MNIVIIVLGTIIFQAAVFSTIFLSRFFDKIFPPPREYRISWRETGAKLIFALLGVLLISVLGKFSNQWFLFYIINFALVVIGIGIWMVIGMRKSHRDLPEEKHTRTIINKSIN